MNNTENEEEEDWKEPHPDVIDLVQAHADGDVTIRQIATLLDISSEEAYEVVIEIYEEHDLGDDESSPTTYTPHNTDWDDTDLWRGIKNATEDWFVRPDHEFEF
jgi:hypothetical protein